MNDLNRKYEAIVMGASSGGTQALLRIIPALPTETGVPVIIVQHVQEGSNFTLPDFLNEKSGVLVKEACDKEPIQPGTVYIAPPGYHLLVEEDRTLALSMDPKVSYARPSIDVLFESAARVFEDNLVGIILTGANSDGSQGLKEVKAFGGLTIVQDPATAEADTMPMEAIKAIQVDHVLELNSIGHFLKGLCDNDVSHS
jgi:two-component system chemotaxis response regulator CheB|tara:strand:- start:3774 stop:4370 length:597 start_codon:yes stop_codon:yes gene_type:complete